MVNAMTQEVKAVVMAKFMTLKLISVVKDSQLPNCVRKHGNAAHQANAVT
jgi:hypothetical protein